MDSASNFRPSAVRLRSKPLVFQKRVFFRTRESNGSVTKISIDTQLPSGPG